MIAKILGYALLPYTAPISLVMQALIAAMPDPTKSEYALRMLGDPE